LLQANICLLSVLPRSLEERSNYSGMALTISQFEMHRVRPTMTGELVGRPAQPRA